MTHKDKSAFERLRYRSRTTVQETGANPLYLTVGRLDWQLGDRSLSAPLILVPVHVKGIVQPLKIELDEGGAVTLNHSLMEKLRLEFGFAPTGLGDLPALGRNGETVDVAAVLQRVREAIADAGLPFRVEGEAQLAVIQFTGYLLWRELDEHWEQLLRRPLGGTSRSRPRTASPVASPSPPGGRPRRRRRGGAGADRRVAGNGRRRGSGRADLRPRGAARDR